MMMMECMTSLPLSSAISTTITTSSYYRTRNHLFPRFFLLFLPGLFPFSFFVHRTTTTTMMMMTQKTQFYPVHSNQKQERKTSPSSRPCGSQCGYFFFSGRRRLFATPIPTPSLPFISVSTIGITTGTGRCPVPPSLVDREIRSDEMFGVEALLRLRRGGAEKGEGGGV